MQTPFLGTPTSLHPRPTDDLRVRVLSMADDELLSSAYLRVIARDPEAVRRALDPLVGRVPAD